MAHGHQHSEHNNHRSSERRFEKFITRIDNQPVGCRRLFCSTPGCGQQGEILDRVHNGMVPHVIRQRFERKGWEVGTNGENDFCPKCVTDRRVERRRKAAENKLRLQSQENSQETLIMTLNNDAAPHHQSIAPKVAPSEPGFANIRVINARLEDVYEDEKTGYKPGWSDAKLASDLGVPEAWVVKVRDQNFGPVRDNQEVRNMLERVEEAAREASGVITEAKALRQDGADYVQKINALMAKATSIEKTLSGLMVTVDRIRQYTGIRS